MATYTIVTTANEEKALTFKVAEKNAERAAETPPKAPLTNEQYIDQILVRRSLLAFKDMMDKADGNAVESKFLAATNSVQNQVKALLRL